MDPITDFHCDSHQVDGLNLSYLDSGGERPPLHFYHANGFPISVYIPFMRILTERFRVLGMGLRGQDAQTEGNSSWHSAADDLIDFLDKRQLRGTIGVGHSVGAVATMIAAARRPELFSKIVLIDPVLLPWRYLFFMAFIRLINRKDLFFLARLARNRRSRWQDRQEAYEYFKTKSLFKNFEEAFFDAYITFGLKPSQDGRVELLCPKDAEARLFEFLPLDIWFWPKKITIPTLIVRGAQSNTLLETELIRFCRKCKSAKARTVENAGHLVPMEASQAVADIIMDFTSKS